MSVITCRSNQLRGASELRGKRPTESFYTYVGGTSGPWEVTQLLARRGELLAPVTHVDIINGGLNRIPSGTAWILSGVVRNTRHVTREEFVLPGTRCVNSAAPTCAALILVRRSLEWWHLGSNARRNILNPESKRPLSGVRHLSAMIRDWRHRRDLSEKFDCLAWFEYERRDSVAFDDLLADWRASEEWKFVDRECDIRLVHSA